MNYRQHSASCGCGPSRRLLIGATAGLIGAAVVGPQVQAAPKPQPVVRGPIIDAHVHLQSPEWFSGNVFQGPPPLKRHRASPPPPRGGLARGGAELEAMTARQGPTRQYGPTLTEQTRRLLDEMDSAGVDTAILYAMDYDYTGEKVRVQHYDQVRLLAEVRDRHPGRFVLFAAVDPRRSGSGVDLLRRLHSDFRISGMGEFAPHFFGFAPNDRERCYPIYQTCAELGLHIAPNCSIVSSSISRWCDPLYFEDVAHDFPEVNLCLTSAGLPHWEESAIGLAQSKPNIYLDIGDWETRSTADPIDTVLRFVRRALDTDARHKILFGSDYPVYNRTVSEKTWVEVFTLEARRRGIAFSDEELFLFFSDNAQEYLNIDLPLRSAGA